ncbi:MAG: peroxidase-related enzyme [Planctomycetes bacterium]|nr:peroxidase-related enzyme [Planctomycetota bacterium]
MQRIPSVSPETAQGKQKELLDAVKKKMGGVPNLVRVFANSPSALEGYLGLSGALGGGKLDARQRERIALTVAEANSCAYCASAHTAIGKLVGLDETDIAEARHADNGNPKARTGLRFARKVLETKGRVSDADLQATRQAGYSDEEILEIVGNVVLNIYTNYINHVADTEIDFPSVKPEPANAIA